MVLFCLNNGSTVNEGPKFEVNTNVKGKTGDRNDNKWLKFITFNSPSLFVDKGIRISFHVHVMVQHTDSEWGH